MTSLGLFGVKVGNTQMFDDATVHHVTVVKYEPMSVIGSRSEDGLMFLQCAYGDVIKHPNKATVGHFKASGLRPRKHLVEFLVDEVTVESLAVGSELPLSLLTDVNYFDVSGITKGHGFAGVVKRHGFSMQPATHGNSLAHRAHGSTGQCQEPGRVFKGKKMAGQMGNVNRTIQNVAVFKIDLEQNLVFLKGAIPGSVGGMVKLSPALKKGEKINLQAMQQTSEAA